MLRAIAYLLILIIIGAIHITVVSVLPEPYNMINITVLALGLLILSGRLSLAVFLALFMGLLNELYAVTPFGLLMVALLLTLIVGRFVATRLITTLNFLGSIALILVMSLTYRLSFIALHGVLLATSEGSLALAHAVQQAAVEAGLTTALCAIVIALYLWQTRHRRSTIHGTDANKPYGILG